MPAVKTGGLHIIFSIILLILTPILICMYCRREEPVSEVLIKTEEYILKTVLENVYPSYAGSNSNLPWHINIFAENIFPYLEYASEERITGYNEYNNPSYIMHKSDEAIKDELCSVPLEPSKQLELKSYTDGQIEGEISPGNLSDYDYLMRNFYNVHTSTTAPRSIMKADKFLAENFYIEKDNKPQILIYHTHSHETYADSEKYEFPMGSVVGVGEVLTELLTEKGYNVIHDKTIYDYKKGKLDRSRAYTYALDGITGILQQNPSIRVILDIHRDGVSENTHLVSSVNGVETAKIMFFNGMSSTPSEDIEYLPNPYREDNLAFSFQLQVKADRYYPGFTRKIYLKGLRYNLHLRKRSALIEVGAQTNTYDEAVNAAVPLAEILDMVLQGG